MAAEEYGALVDAQLVGGTPEGLEEDFLERAEKAVVAAGRGVRHTTACARLWRARQPSEKEKAPRRARSGKRGEEKKTAHRAYMKLKRARRKLKMKEDLASLGETANRRQPTT